MRNIALILGLALIATACGTKGPLTLPPTPVPQSATPAAAPLTATDASTKAEPAR